MTHCIEEGILRTYVDDMLRKAERDHLTLHISACIECQKHEQELKTTSAQLGALLAVPLASTDAQAALTRLRKAQERTAEVKQTTSTRPLASAEKPRITRLGQIQMRPAMVGAGLGLAMVLVLGISVLLGSSARSSSKPARPRPTFPADLGASVLLQQINTVNGRYEIGPVDPVTGRSMPGYKPVVSAQDTWYNPRLSFSTDGAKLAIVAAEGKSCEPGFTCRGSAGTLHLIDLPTWQEVTATLSLTVHATPGAQDKAWQIETGKGWVGPLSFSPDNSRLAMNYNRYIPSLSKVSQAIVVVDATNGKPVAYKELDFRPSLLEFSEDGTHLIVYGQAVGSPLSDKPAPPHVAVLDATSLKVQWDQPLDGIVSGSWCEAPCAPPQGDGAQREGIISTWTPAVVLSEDHRRLYIVHADENKLTTVDIGAHTISSLDIQAARSWFEELLASTATTAQAKGNIIGATKNGTLSPDGTRLYVAGFKWTPASNEQQTQRQQPLGLQVVNIENGRQIATYGSNAVYSRVSPDGARLYLEGWDASNEHSKVQTEVLDTKTLQKVGQAGQWQVLPTPRLDGQSIVLGAQYSSKETQFAVLDPDSLNVIHSWTVSGWATWVLNRSLWP